MKISSLLAIASVAILTTFEATATPLPTGIYGPLTFNWSLLTTNLVDAPRYSGAGKTNVTGNAADKTTNIVQVSTWSSKSTPSFGNANFLELLANSLDTTFPAGAKLIIDNSTDVYVVDHTGTNVITNATAVLTITTTNEIQSGVSTLTQTLKSNYMNETIVASRSRTSIVTIKYDDSGLPTTDGTTSNFKFFGTSTGSGKSTETISAGGLIKVTGSQSYTVHGVGSGTIRGVDYIIQGTIMGQPSGTEVVPE